MKNIYRNQQAGTATIIILVTILCLCLFFSITGYLLAFIFGFAFCFFEVLLIYPLCLLLSNRKNYSKLKFIKLLVAIIIFSSILTYFCFWINKYPSLANAGFWFLLFCYLVIIIPIIRIITDVKEGFTFNIFKEKSSIILFFLFFLSYLSYSAIFSDFVEYYQENFFINNEMKIGSAGKVDYCHINNINFKYDEKGAVLVNGKSFSDYCLDGKTLMEQWCMRDPEDFTKYYYGTEKHKCNDACLDGRCVPFSVVNQPFTVNLSLSSKIYKLFEIKLNGTNERASEYKLMCKSGTGEYKQIDYEKYFNIDNTVVISDINSLNRNLTYTCYVEVCLIDNCSISNELTFIRSDTGEREAVAKQEEIENFLSEELRSNPELVIEEDYCSDTDQGLNFWEHGIVYIGNVGLFDECVNNKFVTEEWCFKDPKTSRYYRGTKKFECEDMCLNGRCISSFLINNEIFNIDLTFNKFSELDIESISFEANITGTKERMENYHLYCKKSNDDYIKVMGSSTSFKDNVTTIKYHRIGDYLDINSEYTCYLEACLGNNCKKSNEINFKTGEILISTGGSIDTINKLYIDSKGSKYSIEESTKLYLYEEETTLEKICNREYCSSYSFSLRAAINKNKLEKLIYSPQ